MKKIMQILSAAALVIVMATSCKKEAEITTPNTGNDTEISQQVLNQIKSHGFGTGSVKKVEGGYLVEGDILLTPEFLSSKAPTQLLRLGDEEHYRTNYLVGYLPRTITIRVSTSLPYYSNYVAATDAAIARYNALGLKLKFARVTSGGNIVINPAPSGAGYLASAGFPSSYGHPYYQVLVNTGTLNSWPHVTKTTILAHEIGHCIGFRHTDFMNRSYSCGGSAVNEGAGTSGAIHIPGTPTGPSANSWMLACIGYGVDRPFTYYDKVALNYVY